MECCWEKLIKLFELGNVNTNGFKGSKVDVAENAWTKLASKNESRKRSLVSEPWEQESRKKGKQTGVITAINRVTQLDRADIRTAVSKTTGVILQTQEYY